MKEDKYVSYWESCCNVHSMQQFSKSDGFEEKVFSTIMSFPQVKNQISLSSYIFSEDDATRYLHSMACNHNSTDIYPMPTMNQKLETQREPNRQWLWLCKNYILVEETKEK